MKVLAELEVQVERQNVQMHLATRAMPLAPGYRYLMTMAYGGSLLDQ
jgi:hypothetical protein